VVLVFTVVAIATLELLPVTYPRSAILLAWARPMAAMLTVGLAIAMCTRSLFRRWFPTQLSLFSELILMCRLAASLLITMSLHFLLKSFIFLINPRVWDRELGRLDKVVHLGIDPPGLLAILFGNRILLHLVDVTYSSLYLVMIVVYTSVFLGVLPPRRRVAFVAAFCFVWILGILFYVILPTWGPVFVVPEKYAATLQFMPTTVAVQHVLYREISSLVRDPLGPRVVVFGCVAAFPSLHVAIVALFTLVSRTIWGRWFQVNVGFLAVMIVGSVISGYHYLIDAYAGLGLAGFAWWAGRALFDQSLPTPPRGSPTADCVGAVAPGQRRLGVESADGSSHRPRCQDGPLLRP